VDKVGKVGAAVLVALLFIALGEGLTIQKIGIGPISIDFSSGDTTTKPPDPGPSSSGPDRPAVPNLAGRNRQAADAALTAAGLTADFVAVDNDAPADQVVSTSPNAGTKVDAHSTVRVEISRGPFVGTWVNVDARTRSIPQVTVDSGSGTSMTLHVWGVCTPTSCDWGTAAATLVGTELRAFKGLRVTNASRGRVLTHLGSGLFEPLVFRSPAVDVFIRYWPAATTSGPVKGVVGYDWATTAGPIRWRPVPSPRWCRPAPGWRSGCGTAPSAASRSGPRSPVP
jgi:hypothetical protein